VCVYVGLFKRSTYIACTHTHTHINTHTHTYTYTYTYTHTAHVGEERNHGFGFDDLMFQPVKSDGNTGEFVCVCVCVCVFMHIYIYMYVCVCE
jgi:hypothetical protein